MKIVHLNTYTEGGAAEAALRLHSALMRSNVESKFVALYKGRCVINEVYDFRDGLNPINFWFTKIKNKQRTINTLRLSKKSGELFSEISSVWKVEQNTEVKSADIVHLHWVSNYVDLPSFFKNKFKIVWTIHDHFLFSGGFHYPPIWKGFVSENKIEEQKNNIKALLSEHPIDIVCPSENLKTLAKNSGVLSKCTFHVIKNPVNTEIFKPLTKEECRIKLNIPIENKVLFFLSDLIQYERKGFPILKKALSLLDCEVTLLVAGKGKLPNKIGKAKVKYFGLVKDKILLNQLYGACDVMVNPSLDDISSNTVIEAMACGRPVVTFNTGGIPELITEVNGLIAKDKTAVELANTINTSLKMNYDPPAIQNKALSEHSFEVIAKKYIEVYAKVK
ncbi:MAG TPA: glycosyltransferase [Bacteroidia bacterium]|jgi:glycosyltransferase involved in cell wall biosynthesis|nr:glycosyltransferase [Bacteroidia bacterium]